MEEKPNKNKVGVEWKTWGMGRVNDEKRSCGEVKNF